MSELGVYDPLTPADAAELLASLDGRWWVGGDWALDVFLGRTHRGESDLDVSVLRADQLKLQQLLSGWELQAHDPPGSLRFWLPGEILGDSVHAIWCRPSPEAVWGMQLTLEETDGDTWSYWRNPVVSRPLTSMFGRHEGRPYLAPDVALLYKAGSMSPNNEADFAACLTELEGPQRAWLAMTLTVAHPGHPWIDRIDATFEAKGESGAT